MFSSFQAERKKRKYLYLYEKRNETNEKLFIFTNTKFSRILNKKKMATKKIYMYLTKST